MKFWKLQATGNDFILVDGTRTPVNVGGRKPGHGDWASLARAMCDRHFGAGADGLILLENSRLAHVKMRIFNADGSEAEVCGNGLRCVAKYVVEESELLSRVHRGEEEDLAHSDGWEHSILLTVETLSGIRTVKAFLAGGEVKQVEVDMGVPRFQPKQIPVAIEVDITPILNYGLRVDGKELKVSILSMGNPHAVLFLSESIDDFPLAEIGPKVERNAAFPERTNFSVARIVRRGLIQARIWERGVGETLACGSGACAVAVAARLLNYGDEEMDIMLKGGTLRVSWDGVGAVFLRGSVEKVFAGEWLKGQIDEAG